MEDREFVKTAAFESRSFSEGRRGRILRPYGLPGRRAGMERRRKKPSGAKVFLLARLGVCGAAFLAVLGIKLAGNERAISALGELTKGEREGTESSLGRLKFVELPSMIEVFAPSAHAVLPVEALSLDLMDDETGLYIVSAYGSDIAAPADGRVKAVGLDPVLGTYVSVMTEDDVEFVIFGLGEVTVEEGQPVKQRQKLGALKGASATVRVWKDGRPADPGEIFGMGKAN